MTAILLPWLRLGLCHLRLLGWPVPLSSSCARLCSRLQRSGLRWHMTVPGITKQLKLSKCSALLRVLACICLASAWEHTTSFVLIFLNCSRLALAVHFVLCQTLLAHDIRGPLEIATVPSCLFHWLVCKISLSWTHFFFYSQHNSK